MMDAEQIKAKFYADVDRIAQKLRDQLEGEMPEESATACLRLAAWCAGLSVVKNGASMSTAVKLADYYIERLGLMVSSMREDEAAAQKQRSGALN